MFTKMEESLVLISESLYSTSEVAKRLGINRVTMYRWVQKGVVKAYKIGKRLKIPISEVERLWSEKNQNVET
jgi:excisionase family DNA binding protein